MEDTTSTLHFLQMINFIYISMIIVFLVIFILFENNEKFENSIFGAITILFYIVFSAMVPTILIEWIILSLMWSVLASNAILIFNGILYIITHLVCVIMLNIKFSKDNKTAHS